MITRAFKFVRKRSSDLSEYGGFLTFFVGGLRFGFHYVLYRIYRFHPWHLNPIEWREYALELCQWAKKFSQEQPLETVVEIGCGLGELISRIPAKRSLGFDCDENTIRAARMLHRKLDLQVGSFDDIRGLRIDLLVAVNFPHEINPEELREKFEKLLRNNDIRYIVVDSVAYQYLHDFDQVLLGWCVQTWVSRQFQNQRRVFCYRVASQG